MVIKKGVLKTCSRGHEFYKTSDCPTCPTCWKLKEKKRPPTDIPNIGAPASRAIAKLGITKLRGFTRYSKQELLALHGVGPKAISIVQKALKIRGLSFKNARSRD